ncbi:hypothetical protein [Neisseria dentiae]|uniref:hypothetical protein n=3 Tax=Neisseria dentiae TaxID=194197 RepID=UPI0035A1121B
MLIAMDILLKALLIIFIIVIILSLYASYLESEKQNSLKEQIIKNLKVLPLSFFSIFGFLIILYYNVSAYLSEEKKQIIAYIGNIVIFSITWLIASVCFFSRTDLTSKQYIKKTQNTPQEPYRVMEDLLTIVTSLTFLIILFNKSSFISYHTIDPFDIIFSLTGLIFFGIFLPIFLFSRVLQYRYYYFRKCSNNKIRFLFFILFLLFSIFSIRMGLYLSPLK